MNTDEIAAEWRIALATGKSLFYEEAVAMLDERDQMKARIAELEAEVECLRDDIEAEFAGIEPGPVYKPEWQKANCERNEEIEEMTRKRGENGPMSTDEIVARMRQSVDGGRRSIELNEVLVRSLISERDALKARAETLERCCTEALAFVGVDGIHDRMAKEALTNALTPEWISEREHYLDRLHRRIAELEAERGSIPIQEHAEHWIAVGMDEVNNCGPLMEWIPVEERLPKEDESVLVFCEAGVKEAFLYEDVWMESCFDNHNVQYSAVTHWQPLPEPPPTPAQE